MSKNEPEKEYVEHDSPIDRIESTHYELERSHGYSGIEADGEYTYSTTRLEALGRAWMLETQNELRSARSRAVALLIVDRIAFELAYRSGQLKQLEKVYEMESI